MSQRERCATLLTILLAAALPAYANNPPEPDGLFSMLLVFPAVVLAMRLASITTNPKRPAARIVGLIAVGVVCVVFLGTGTELGAAAALCIVIYAFVRAGQVVSRGVGTRRWWIASGLVVFSLFAFADYFASIMGMHSTSAVYEARAVGCMRTLGSAESEFGRREKSIGTLQDLEQAKLIEDGYSGGRLRFGYRYGEFIDQDTKEYVFYAMPDETRRRKGRRVKFVPGSSLIEAVFGSAQENGTGYRTFAIDQTGVIRYKIREHEGPVTRDEIRQWTPLG